MIKNISVAGLRGIKEGRLSDLARLTVLVGPNGAGKSTMLDALLIGAGLTVGEGVGRAVRRRCMDAHTSRHFFLDPDGSADIRVEGAFVRECTLSWQKVPDAAIFQKLEMKYRPPYSQIRCLVQSAGCKQLNLTGFDGYNNYVYHWDGDSVPFVKIRFVDSTVEVPLDRLYSDVVTRGRRRDMKDVLKEVIPYLVDVELLTNENDRPSLYIIDKDDKAVPLALAGDGIVGFARLTLSMMSRDEDLLLVEEPETHQHPGCIKQTAAVLWRAVKDGRQVVLTTHSLELIDQLVLQSDGHLKDLALFKLFLRDGKLASSRLSGPEVEEERFSIEEDLR